MDFIKELTESRMFKRLGQYEGRSVHYIAERFFEHLLALQILVHEDPKFAAKYADDIMAHQHFDGFRTSMSDLFNMIVLIIKQDQYSHILETDPSIVVPELRLRRVLRAIARTDFNNNDYSELLMMLQRRMPELPAMLIQLRRQISNWKRASNPEKKRILQRLRMHMREPASMQSDLYVVIDKLERTL